jgi:hypothetical protein
MARDKRKGGRTTPKGTRPLHLRPVVDADDPGSPVDSIIDSGGRELLEEDDPVAAETWASGMLDVFEQARWKARLDRLEVPPFEEALLQRCRQRRDKRAAAVAAALAAVVPPPHHRLATTVAEELRRAVPGLPAWLWLIGRVEPTRGWVASDVFGDQDSLTVGFRQEGKPEEHALVVLVDHNLSGQAKDAWIGSDFDEVVGTWKSSGDPHMRMGEVPVDEALRRLRDAVAMSDLCNGDTGLRTEDFARHRALMWARLRRAGLPNDGISDVEVRHSEREALVAEFMASEQGRDVASQLGGTDVELLVHGIVDLRSDYEGRPLRWSPTVVSIVLGDLAPRKLLLAADQAAALPAVARAFVRFSAGRSGLEAGFVAEILRAVDDIEPEFLHRMGDPAAAGPAKAMLAALQARGVDVTDIDAINEALQKGGPMKLPEAAPKRRRRTSAASVEIVASAERAPVMGRFDELFRFYGEGRKLTQTGQPTLADARSLVTLLGTRDRIDQTIGDRTFKTKSAAELPELGFTIRWAIAAGALRKEHGRLRATAAWAKLASKPLDRWMKAADALPSLGPLAAYHKPNRYRDPNEILDEQAAEILHMLADGPKAYEEVLDWVCEDVDATYEWTGGFMKDPEHRRMSLGWDLDRLARILGWAGIVDRVGATVEPDRYEPEREHLVGGSLQLTPVGRWWLGGA